MTITKLSLSFEQYLDFDDGTDSLYELVDGALVLMPDPSIRHDDIAEFLDRTLYREVKRLGLNYAVKRHMSVKLNSKNGRKPDVLVIDRQQWRDRSRTIAAYEPPLLVIEVVSSNWQDDYEKKFSEYETLGIAEYWIVDYLAKASTKFLGDPKMPAIFVNSLVDGKYQSKVFTGSDRVISAIFPELSLTADRVLEA